VRCAELDGFFGFNQVGAGNHELLASCFTSSR
jgi:hypothetical protein